MKRRHANPVQSHARVCQSSEVSQGARRSHRNDWRVCLFDNDLVAVAVQCSLNHWFHARSNRRGPAQITTSLLGQTKGQVARTGGAVHCFARRRQAEPFLGALVRLHLCFFNF